MAVFRRRYLWLALSLALIVMAQGARADVQNGKPAAYPALFGTREVRGGSLAPFKKWTGMLARQATERGLYDDSCASRRFNLCHLQQWRRLLKEVSTKDKLAQLDAVNSFMNRAPYITDPVNYGVADYWATPLQFLTKDGDCEDYAIAKFVSLRELGFANAQMRIVVVDDLNLRVPHAVLVVNVDGRALVLDNQIPQVVPADRIRHYRPVFSINEEAWWLHRP